MPKVKIPRKSTIVDMTAMCDVAFLLLTFFMLTSNFTAKEPAKISTPTSISEIKIPETNVEMILIDPKGKVFFGIDGPAHRANLLKAMGAAFKISFTPEEIKKFSLIATTGVPMSRMKAFLAIDDTKRDVSPLVSGVPCDSLHNEFKQWVHCARVENSKLMIAIKGDKETPITVVKQVMKTLQDLTEVKFNLITGLEEAPKDL